MKIYTRTGDKGQTSLFGGERVSKTHIRVQAYGSVDELNSYLGLCIAQLSIHSTKFTHDAAWMLQVQRDLFALGSWLASREASERVSKGEEAFAGQRSERTKLNAETITKMENQIDSWEKELSPMKSFILPGGSLAGAHVHCARTLCRKSEREVIALQDSGELVPELVVQYLNRLADALFVFARVVNNRLGVPEEPWL